MSSRNASHGYQPQWKPRARTRELLAAVDRILERYAVQLPLTIRQVWYSLISDGVLVKEERTYKQTVELLGMARRSGRIVGLSRVLLGLPGS
ncbi:MULTISPECIES: hypothetical protein [Streptomyces]|uniref:hypothetical protein n=1 Tax=Streptomyces TaxID=1883 RepID=UPI000F553BB0|nr:hypothetical protein [Streptomyces sp. ADI98-10]